MNKDEKGSVTQWLESLRTGDSVAAQNLWNRYFAQLVGVAHQRLNRVSAESSGEDVALSALKSVVLGVRANRFQDVTDRTNLWPLLVTITARKAISELRRQLAKKRSAKQSQPATDLLALISDDPSPEFALQVADELQRLVTSFDDETLRKVAFHKLEGYSNEEIANDLGCSTRTVIRKLNRIRQEWEEIAAQDSDSDHGNTKSIVRG